MTEVNHVPSVAAVLGDLVGSRLSADRRELHRVFGSALREVNEELAPVSPLRIQAGDEFQGAFADVGAALRATWRLRWALAGRAELRYGVGWGPVTVLQDEPRVEDGPGWWAAREAIQAVATGSARPATRHLRTAYRVAPTGARVGAADEHAVNAALLCRDHLVGSLSDRSRRVLGLLVAGHTQAEIARAEGISASAVSQRVRGEGLTAVLAAQELLEGVRVSGGDR